MYSVKGLNFDALMDDIQRSLEANLEESKHSYTWRRASECSENFPCWYSSSTGYVDNSASGVLTNDSQGPPQRFPHSLTKLGFALEVSATFARGSRPQVSQNDQP